MGSCLREGSCAGRDMNILQLDILEFSRLKKCCAWGSSRLQARILLLCMDGQYGGQVKCKKSDVHHRSSMVLK